MSRYQLGWGALLASGFLAGCASSQMNRIDANRELYESWPIEIRQAVLDGKVEPGMTPEMVRVAWGKPTEVVVQGSSGDEIWVYKRGGSDGSVYYPGGGAAGYPGGAYPGGAYPGGGVMGPTGTGVVIGTGGRGVGTTIGTGIGGGVLGGPGYPGGVVGGPIVTPPTPPEIREVVFRNGVVQRADAP